MTAPTLPTLRLVRGAFADASGWRVVSGDLDRPLQRDDCTRRPKLG
jgi:hypothetical protein